MSCSHCGTKLPVAASDSESVASAMATEIASGSRPHALLHSNEVPLESEIPFFRAAVSQTTARLARLDAEIVRLQARLGELEGERTTLAGYRAQNKAVLSPLRRLPPEVLGEVFSWTLPPLREALRRGRMNIEQSCPWVLTRVSRRWRTVCIATPGLWADITLDYSLDATEVYPVAAVKTQLARARGLVRVHFYGNEESECRPQVEMFRYLAEEAGRWEELSLTLTPDLLPLMAGLRNRVRALRRLWLQYTGERVETEPIDCFNASVDLLHVGVCRRNVSPQVLFPAQQLTWYHVDAPWDVHWGILKATHHLVKAHIGICDGGEDNVLPWRPSAGLGLELIDLARLRCLYVSHIETLSYLRADILEEIAFFLGPDEEPDILPPLDAFIARAPEPRFRALCIVGLPNFRTTIEMLRRFPGISELSFAIEHWEQDVFVNNINTYGGADALLAHLTFPAPPAGRTAPVTLTMPHLSRISFGCQDEVSFNYGLYVQMLRSRWDVADRALEAAVLLVEDGPRPEPALLEELDDLREEGLDFLFLEGREAYDSLTHWTFRPLWV
ncbi:hypothetical protein B0H11DRAFT_1998885 [Mycena galericulata]|nr:hypothetical protein B0H11DRAFT_1998885 [Mycena galericulata]